MGVATDPSPFLSTIILASAGLVAIVGGLLVARFVTLDSDQRGSRKILVDATERLRSARDRAGQAHADLLAWYARQFFRGPVLDAASEGVSDPAVLMQLGEWPLNEEELRPVAAEVADEFARARAALADRGDRIDDFPDADGWEQFKRATPDLPEIHWDRAWERVFEGILLTRAEERKAAKRPSSSSFFGSLDHVMEQTRDPAYLRRMAHLAPVHTDYAAIRARQEDELEAAAERTRQRVEDYEGELRRAQNACAEIVRPDAWLWSGVGILTVLAIAGVGVPMWVMSLGPSDLGGVRWLIYPFAGSLLMLIVYIVLYLMHLTRAGNQPQPEAGTAS